MSSTHTEQDTLIDSLYRELSVEVYNSWNGEKTRHFRGLLMEIPSNLDKFMKLSHENQAVIVQEESCFTAATLRNFLSAYAIIDVDDFSAVWDCGWNTEDFFKVTGTSNEDAPSSKFESFSHVHSWEIDAAEVPMYAVLYVLRSVFGETTVIEACKSLHTEGLLWWNHDIVEICSNWDSLKFQPVQWISSIYGHSVLKEYLDGKS